MKLTCLARLEGGSKARQKAVSTAQNRLCMASVDGRFRKKQKRSGLDLVNESNWRRYKGGDNC